MKISNCTFNYYLIFGIIIRKKNTNDELFHERTDMYFKEAAIELNKILDEEGIILEDTFKTNFLILAEC